MKYPFNVISGILLAASAMALCAYAGMTYWSQVIRMIVEKIASSR